jgi:hypothetical protein
MKAPRMKSTPPSPPMNWRLVMITGQLWAKEFKAAEGARPMI